MKRTYISPSITILGDNLKDDMIMTSPDLEMYNSGGTEKKTLSSGGTLSGTSENKIWGDSKDRGFESDMSDW